ncbi:hypothetical protein [Alienimonas californiensis]|nr:hypothetical protein [Alienimonas californiensis]
MQQVAEGQVELPWAEQGYTGADPAGAAAAKEVELEIGRQPNP